MSSNYSSDHSSLQPLFFFFVYSSCTLSNLPFLLFFFLATVWAPLVLLPVSESGENCDHLQFSSRTNLFLFSVTDCMQALSDLGLISRPASTHQFFFSSHSSSPLLPSSHCRLPPVCKLCVQPSVSLPLLRLHNFNSIGESPAVL